MSLVAGLFARERVVIAGDRAWQNDPSRPQVGSSVKVAAIGGALVSVVGRSTVHDEAERVRWDLLGQLRELAPAKLTPEDIPELARQAAEATSRRPGSHANPLVDPKYNGCRVAVFWPTALANFSITDDGAGAVQHSPQSPEMPAHPHLFGLVPEASAAIRAGGLSPRSTALAFGQRRIGDVGMREAISCVLEIEHLVERAEIAAGSRRVGGGVDVLILSHDGRVAEGSAPAVTVMDARAAAAPAPAGQAPAWMAGRG